MRESSNKLSTVRFKALSLGLTFIVVISISVVFARSHSRSQGQSLWDVSKTVRSGAGGMEAERDTWVRRPRVFTQTATSGKQEWDLKVAGDARPVMRRMTIENLKGRVEAPFLLTDKNYDFRSLPELVASVVRGAKTDEQKALALRELLIGEGFFFHHSS